MHQILFKNCENSWKNALPLGNGIFGAMAFYKDNSLSIPMNHYEVYYTISDSVLPEALLRDMPDYGPDGSIHREYDLKAEHNQPGEDGLFFYREITRIWKKALKQGGILAVEVGINEAEAVADILNAEGFKNIGFKTDLLGIQRVVFGTAD